MNLADVLRTSADSFGAKPALIFGGRSISYDELDERVDNTVAALAALGVGRGDRVALVAGNIPEFVYALYGALRAGAAVCPLNVMLTAEEMSYMLADSGAKVAVVELPFVPDLLEVREGLTELQTILVIGGPPAPAGTVSLEEALRGAEDAPEVPIGPDDLALVAYTSGTTADPRGAMLTHGNLVANMDQMSSVPLLAAGPDDVALLALPLFHAYALNAVLGLTMKAGGTAVLVERFDPLESLDIVRRHATTLLFGVPTMFAAWLRAVEAPDGRTGFSSVRLGVSGAAPLPVEVLDAFRDRFGVVIWEGYGLTEASPAVTTNAMGARPKASSIGLPLPGMEVRLVGEDGEDVEEGDPGELWVKGPNVFAGYWGRPDASAEVLADGWLRTGDVAIRDDEGYLFLVDRKKDLVIVSGFNVFPREVEEAIAEHPGVAEAAVVAIPDQSTGEAIQAWVVPGEGAALGPEEILEFLRPRLARFKLPKDVRVVEELPHHATGKVLRRMLRDQAPD